MRAARLSETHRQRLANRNTQGDIAPQSFQFRSFIGFGGNPSMALGWGYGASLLDDMPNLLKDLDRLKQRPHCTMR